MSTYKFFRSRSISGKHAYRWLGGMLLIALLLAACQSAAPAPTLEPMPAATQEPVVETETPQEEVVETEAPEVLVIPEVLVSDQSVEAGTVTVAEVTSAGPGWIVIHSQAEGKPGPILGYTQINDGASQAVVVEIDAANATETLYAMLHTDAGEIGVWEFPDGPDTPVQVDGKVVTPPFKVAMQTALDAEPVVLAGGSDQLGEYLVGADGMTLYVFANDASNTSNCYDACAENWPPLVLEEGQALIPGEGVGGELGLAARSDGSQQVTINGMPLYYWVNDSAPGDTTGHGVRGVWAVAGMDTMMYVVVPGESKVSYEVGETFLNDNRFAVALGVTEQVEGRVYLDLSNPRLAWVGPITVDISQFASDNQRRDDKIRGEFLQSAQYPMATFVPTGIEGLPESYTEGQEITLQITGDLTVREVTKPVTFEAVVKVQDGALMGQAKTTILMSDFGVGPISILGILETEDEVVITFDWIARP